MTTFLLILGLLLPTVATTTATTDDVCRPVTGMVPLDLPEASGVAVGSGRSALLFAIGDSGPPVLTVLDQSGAAVRKVTLNGAKVTDWEAITAARCDGKSCLYVGDIGDNSRSRRSVTLYRVDEAAAASATSADAETFELVYPDGPHDAESLFATSEGQLFLVTKERGRATIFRAPHPLRSGQRNMLSVAAALTLAESKGSGITDAAASRDGKWIVLRSNDSMFLYRAAELLEQRAAKPIQVDLRALNEPQGEGIAFGPEGTVYVVGEGGSKNRPGSFIAMQCTLLD
jgi:uncharacterized protein YjiK